MGSISDGNVHAIEHREAKPSQGGPSRPVSELFRLDDRTILSQIHINDKTEGIANLNIQ